MEVTQRESELLLPNLISDGQLSTPIQFNCGYKSFDLYIKKKNINNSIVTNVFIWIEFLSLQSNHFFPKYKKLFIY